MTLFSQELHSGPDERVPDREGEEDETVCRIPVQSSCGRTHRPGQLDLVQYLFRSWHINKLFEQRFSSFDEIRQR